MIVTLSFNQQLKNLIYETHFKLNEKNYFETFDWKRKKVIHFNDIAVVFNCLL